MKRFLPLPLVAFVLLVVLLGRGLQLDARELPSALVGKPVPAFSAVQLGAPQTPFSPESMRGQVWVLNVWASWCAPCREELPAVKTLAASAPVIGLNYKDDPKQAGDWLARFGNPYRATVLDDKGKIGIDYGIYGVPETFVIDRQGVVRLRHAGPITPAVLRDKLLPLIRELGRG